MVESWGGFLLIYFLIAAIPAVILALRGRGWRPLVLAASLLVTWTGGGWIIMVWLAMLEKSAGASLYVDRGKPFRDDAD